MLRHQVIHDQVQVDLVIIVHPAQVVHPDHQVHQVEAPVQVQGVHLVEVAIVLAAVIVLVVIAPAIQEVMLGGKKILFLLKIH